MDASDSKAMKKDGKDIKYKLHYFNIRGRAEPIRLLLALNGIAWEEAGIDYKDMKNKAGTECFPFGQCPALEEVTEVDGSEKSKFFAQMDAIMRRLGHRYGQYNGNEDDTTHIDMVLIGG